jgi:hypothetical protein
MFYGDGMITPAILGAVRGRGLEIIAPGLHPFIVPTTIAILVALFAIQRHGTGRVGALFGPVMCLWFVVIAVLGAMGVARQPGVLVAINRSTRSASSWTPGAFASSRSGDRAGGDRHRGALCDMGTSASRRYAARGLCFVMPRWCSTTLGRAR